MNWMQTRHPFCVLALTWKDFFFYFSCFCLFFLTESLRGEQSPISIISYRVTGSFSRSRPGLECVLRTSILHDDLVLQFSYLPFVCSAAGHQWLTMSPDSSERNQKTLFGSLSPAQVAFPKPRLHCDIIRCPWCQDCHTQKQS